MDSALRYPGSRIKGGDHFRPRPRQASWNAWTGWSRPFTWTSLCAVAHAHWPSSCSSRAARFTTSPMTVYSLRSIEPTLPVTRLAGAQLDPDDGGAGWDPAELASVGVPIGERGARTDEYLAVM